MLVRTCLITLIIIVANLLTPGATSAQPMVSGFEGTVTAGGSSLPDGTIVSAWVDGVKVTETDTQSSMYSVWVYGEYTDKTVTFRVGKFEAAQTGAWTRGETSTVNLSINAWPYQCDFYGMATIDGNHVPDGTTVSAWIDSARVQSTTTTDSLYRLVVPGNYAEKAVAFKIGAEYATQLVSWERGGAFETNLTVSMGPMVCGFYGTVQLDGESAADGIEVTAWINGVKVGKAIVADSKYGLFIDSGNYSAKLVVFEVNAQRATESTVWVRGDNKSVNLTAITKKPPVVTLDLSEPSVRPGEEFTVSVVVTPNGHGISGAAIDLLSVDTEVMDILSDGVVAGTLLGSDAIEGINEKTVAETGETFRYALARKGTTPVPTEATTLVTIPLRIKGSAKSGRYAIPNAVSLTDQDFADLDFAPPTVFVTVAASTPGDIDGSDSVGLTDLVIMASAYGTKDGDEGYRNEADLNGDSEIGLADLAILAGHWG